MRDLTHLRWQVTDTIATVLLARPPVNAVNQKMYRELEYLFSHLDLLEEAAGEQVKVVILAGSGRHFCAGNDLTEFATLTPDNSAERMAEVRAAFFAIQDCPVPVVAAVTGAAFGTGLAIAASCDFVVAADDARFGTPEVGVGIMGGAKHLSRLVPEPWVRWMYLTAEPLSGARMAELGAVVATAPAEKVGDLAQEQARSISRHSGPILRMAKRSLNSIETMDLQPGYAFEQGLTGEICGHPDSKEAVRATYEQRAPRYPSEVST
ncbi:enoyl-CoA hydratase/isomerase family protein [Pseudonocardia halophobica]|uniref:Enoyl-CoA hydratase n=1 Tax=Pseudonocardia halophobica TaxID=29401 RepID=A0A9W6L090_9PSEU|nr:enoyl-CoA hydratase [Pseudonocardia halophobica]